MSRYAIGVDFGTCVILEALEANNFGRGEDNVMKTLRGPLVRAKAEAG